MMVHNNSACEGKEGRPIQDIGDAARQVIIYSRLCVWWAGVTRLNSTTTADVVIVAQSSCMGRLQR